MSKRGPKRLRRTEYYVAMRATAVRGVQAAFPHMSSAEIADALGWSRHVVKRVLLGNVKAEQNARPWWAPELITACQRLAGGQPARAAEPLERLARRLYAEGGP